MRMEAACEPRDVLANRLDPWHGVYYHPHTFKRLKVIRIEEGQLVVRVVYGITGRLGIEVDAIFSCPDRRTITMTIVGGEGATSDRPGFRRAIRAAWMIRPFILRAQRRLWAEDAAYAERRYALRSGSVSSAP
jgi:isorenieratene synthase